MIRFYPSRHHINIYPCADGQAIDSASINEPMTIHEWMVSAITANADGSPQDIHRDVQPISYDVNGYTVPDAAWKYFIIYPDDDVRIYPVPFAAGAAFFAAYGAYIAVAIAAIALVYALSISTESPDSGTISGDRLDLNPAKANGVKLYEPIREVLGRAKIYPDYALQPVTRFFDTRDARTSMFLVVGVGRFVIPPSQIKIGETPIGAFGSEVSYAIYPPGADVSGDPRSENWYSAPEVGASKSATAGLDLGSPDSTSAVSSDAILVTGYTITAIGQNITIPDNWADGTILTLIAPDTFTVNNSGTHSVISGPLGELQPFAGMQVTLTILSESIPLTVESYSPYVPPVPGVGGNPSSVTASAAPSTYDFSSSPIVWDVTFRGITRSLSLTANYVNMSGIVAQLTSQLSGMGLVAQDDSGRLKLLEPSSPYRGGTISMSSTPVPIFGVGPVYVNGNASTGGTPEQLAQITLNYESGQPFSGIPDGLHRISLGYRQNRYRVSSVADGNITVARLNDLGSVDSSWPGFLDRTVLDYLLSSTVTDDANWIGPFMACPEGELVDRIEWDIFFPGGLQSTTSKGGQTPMISPIIMQYADVETGEWVSVAKTYEANTRDGIGYTEAISLPGPIRPMVRVRRESVSGYNVVSDAVQWYALRGRLQQRPSRYDGVTCIALTVRTGSRLSAQSDRQINLVATRIYDQGSARSISGAFEHICRTLPDREAAYDSEELEDLESSFWTPRGELFDHSFDKQVTVKEALQSICTAGMSYVAVEDSKVTAIREGVRQAVGAITPHEQAGELVTSFISPSADDYSGVDVKYIHPVTFAVEIVECRIPGIEPLKIETYTLEGVQSETRAWRIGMRRLMKYQYQRLTHKTDTELSALVYRMLDHVVMTDDIPGNETVSSIIESIDDDVSSGLSLYTTSEDLDWSFSNPRVMIKDQYGGVSTLLIPARVSDNQFTIPTAALEMDVDWSLEPPRLVFCSSTKVGYSAMIDTIEPDPDGRCSVIAKQYSDEFYKYDDSAPPSA